MRRLGPFHLLVSSALLLVACKGSPSSSSSAEASANGLDPTCKSAAGAFAKSFAPLIADKTGGDKKPELTRAIEAAIVGSCETDAWDATTLKCLATMSENNRHACIDLLPKDKQTKFEQAVKDAQRKVLGLPESASAAAPSGPGAAPTLTAATSMRGKAFALGERIGFAAVERTLGANTDSAFEEAKGLAKQFDLELPPLPPLKADKAENGAAALDYILDKTDTPLAGKIATKSGKDAAALFEMGLKSELLRMLYIGDKKDELVDGIVKGIRGNGALAKLPADLPNPLVAKLDALADPDDVEKALDAWDLAVSAKLAGEGAGTDAVPNAPSGGKVASPPAKPAAAKPKEVDRPFD